MLLGVHATRTLGPDVRGDGPAFPGYSSHVAMSGCNPTLSAPLLRSLRLLRQRTQDL